VSYNQGCIAVVVDRNKLSTRLRCAPTPTAPTGGPLEKQCGFFLRFLETSTSPWHVQGSNVANQMGRGKLLLLLSATPLGFLICTLKK
jgi:hypothetical protein